MPTRNLARLLSLGAFVGALTFVGAIAGCGQKGPLFLPEEKLEELERRREERKDEKPPPAKSSRLAVPPGPGVIA